MYVLNFFLTIVGYPIVWTCIVGGVASVSGWAVRILQKIHICNFKFWRFTKIVCAIYVATTTAYKPGMVV